MALRVLIAGLLVAIAVGGAVWLHGYRQAGGCYTIQPGQDNGPARVGDRVCPQRVKPSWADPVAIGGVIAALAVGTSLIVVGLRRD